MNSPVVRDIAGYPATVTSTGRTGDEIQLKMIPSVCSDGTISTRFELKDDFAGMHNLGAAPARSIVLTSRAAEGKEQFLSILNGNLYDVHAERDGFSRTCMTQPNQAPHFERGKLTPHAGEMLISVKIVIVTDSP